MRKRKSPIAKNLINNSVSAMFSAIEIHNKPTIKYRYEMVVLLVLNSWELLLKGYLYKYHKDVKLFYKDGTTKTFENCANIINQKIGKNFNAINENLNVLYDYRNQVAHFYFEELDPIIFSLISKNIIFYSEFIKKYFKIDISNESDLILLPIGFKRPTTPLDYISATSFNEKSPPEIKAFLQNLVNASKRLNDEKIEETIFVDFRMNLLSVNKTTNADLIAGIDNSKSNKLALSINKEPRKVVISNEGEKISLTRNRDEAQGTIYYEELQEGIFDEINNILDANRLLAKGNQRFVLGASLYYRIYSERQHVNFTIETFDLLARTGSMDFYGPFFFWLTKLPPIKIVDILFDLYNQSKSPHIHNLTKIAFLLGKETVELFNELLEERFKRVVQKPDFYYTFQEQMKSKNTNPVLKALKATSNKILVDNYSYGQLMKDSSIPIKIISQRCLNVFKGDTTQRSLIRELDFLTYGQLLIGNEQIIEELKNEKRTNVVNKDSTLMASADRDEAVEY